MSQHSAAVPARAAGRARPRLKAGALATASILAFVLALGGLAEAVHTNPDAALLSALNVALVASTVTVGAVLIRRLPRHPVGWFLFTGGLLVAVSAAAGALADYGLNEQPGSIPDAVGFEIISSTTGGMYLGLLGGFVPLYFPTGRLLSPRWRVVVVLGFAATFLPAITNLLGPLPVGSYPADATNPIALGGIGGQLIALMNVVLNIAGLAALVLVIASVALRYRRAHGVERAQLKWFAYVGLLVVPVLVIAIVTSTATSGPLVALANLGWIIGVGGLALLPVSIGIAILRYRLYDIDRLVSRTISWAAVTLILGASFVLVILVAQALLAPFTGSNELAVAGSTLIVAALFQPIRRRVQRFVDHRFNRARYDADRTVRAFAGRLRDEVDLEQLQAEILATVSQTVEPTSVSLWLRE